MKKFRIVRTAVSVGLSVMCACALAACSGEESTGDAQTPPSYTGGVAATVNGVEIQEDTVTEYIENLRAQYGLTDEDSWGSYLSMTGMTPETLREDVIDSYVSEELVKEAVKEQNITVDDETVQGYVDKMAANYESDEAWQAALEKVGMTEDEYRAEIRERLESKAFMETFAPEEEATDEELLEFAQSYAVSNDGAKRSSMILFAADDEATAQEVLDKINAGDLDFDKAAEEYSTDPESKDQGWDKTGSLSPEYQSALDELEKDQVSGLVNTDLGIQIIKCTEVYTAPKTTGEDGKETVEITSLDQLPEEWIEDMKEQVKEQKTNEAYQAWLEEEKKEADIVINPMPEGLPYNVDMSKYEQKDEAAAESSEASTDEAPAEGEAAEGEAPAEGEGNEAAEAEAAPEAEGADAAAEGEAPADEAAEGEAEASAEGEAAEQPAEATGEDAAAEQPAAEQEAA
ncbi:peptidylprolyl isomerase [Eggerthellaceae bacterium zg-893]|nr:peptidylprolyl isomerase [Eggerthellaceae bacterium zg-893]